MGGCRSAIFFRKDVKIGRNIHSMYQFSILLLAWLIILIDLFLLYKNRNNKLLLILNFCIFFFNYSICVGEYIANNLLLENNYLYNTRHGNLYIDGIFLLFVFDCIRLLFFNRKIPNVKIQYRSNIVIFYLILFYLIYVAIFEINREPSLLYEVKITAVYEYSILFFVFLIYYSGQSSFRNLITHLLAIAFIVQDMYYGGRVTSLQLIFLFLMIKHSSYLKFKRLILGFPIALFAFTVVGAYRTNYNLDLILVDDVFKRIKDTWFVQDTAVCAFFASITQINAYYYISDITRLSSFISFIASILGGSQAPIWFQFDPELPLVTSLAKQYHWNMGGGLIFTWYYFWGGFSGMLLLSVLTLRVIKKMLLSNNDLCKLISITIVFTMPRWYLYSPLAFWRGSFFIFPILYFFFYFLDIFIKRLLKQKI